MLLGHLHWPLHRDVLTFHGTTCPVVVSWYVQVTFISCVASSPSPTFGMHTSSKKRLSYNHNASSSSMHACQSKVFATSLSCLTARCKDKEEKGSLVVDWTKIRL